MFIFRSKSRAVRLARLVLVVLVGVVLAGLSACSLSRSLPDSSVASDSSKLSNASGREPAPESTIAVSAADAQGASISQGLAFVVVLPVLVTGDSSSTVGSTDPAAESSRNDAVTALRNYATQHGASVSVITGTEASDPDALLQEAVASNADIVVTFGADALSSLDRTSSSNLGQQFLIIGGQLPEPTENVTAVVWPGADDRESTAAGPPGELASPIDLGTRAAEAIAIGVASVVSERTGFVLALP